MRISVIVPTRDRAASLERALDSLLAQNTSLPYEIVIADNGSSDATPALLAARAQNDGRVRSVSVPQPNRAAARNAAIALARGSLLLFCDDDVVAPPGYVAAHAAAHGDTFPVAVSGPILNVPSAADRPSPSWKNGSRAFFCTCNVSVPRTSLLAAGGFDPAFDRYGWEDTELGLRLRARDVRRAFAWDAYLWHVKPPAVETLDVVAAKTRERAAMAALLLARHDGWRTRLATGAYGPNLVRSAVLAPRFALAGFRRAAESAALPAVVRAIARGQYLDGTYVAELRSALRSAATGATGATAETGATAATGAEGARRR